MFTIALWRMPSIIPQKLRDARKARILEIQEIKHALVIRDFLRGATLQGKSQKHLIDEVEVKERNEEAEEEKIEKEEQDEYVQKEEGKEKEGAESQGQEQKEDMEDVEQSSNLINQSGQVSEEFNSSLS